MTMQYVTGGTMLAQSVSYVVRDADHVLQEKLLQGEFCYVLTPRQMGKSSLMIHTAVALREQGVASASIDLSKQGYTLNVTQWYNGLLEKLAECLDLEDEMEAFCRAHSNHSPLQRWDEALRKVILEQIPGPVVIFVDEIDITRRLSFETDEFFAGIRACYNARTQDAAYSRLTFCLLGVATPSDLIRDPLLTPFNIGSRIGLRDFTYEEASILRHGLGYDELTNQSLMQQIYYWTQGHPYLTQCLCKAVAENSAIRTPDDVDRCCQELFLDSISGYSEDNLTFVRNRLMAGDEQQRAALLTLYLQILSGKRVPDNEAVACVPELKLSGVVRAENGCLIARNPIYRTVFDKKWVRDHMPDAELRHQRAAYRRGVLRAAAVGAVILVAFATGYIAVDQSLRANEAQQRREIQEKTARIYRYNLAILQAQSSLQAGNISAAFRSLEQQRPKAKEPDLRGFEWRYLWQHCQGDQFFYFAPNLLVFSVAISPNGRIVAAGGQDATGQSNTIRLWDAASHREITTLVGPGEVNCIAFSPNGRFLAAGGGIPFGSEKPGTVKLWDMETRRELPALSERKGEVRALDFSPDGRTLASGGEGGTVRLWDITSHRMVATLSNPSNRITCLAFSHDGRILAVGDAAGQVDIRDVHTRMLMRTIRAHSADGGVFSVAFSPDSRILATGGDDKKVRLWDVHTGKRKGTLPHSRMVYSVAFSPDGKTLTTACWDDIVRLWDVASLRETRELIGHLSLVNSVAFTSDSKTLLTGGNDGTVRVWDVNPKHYLPEIIKQNNSLLGVALSADGKTLATAGKDKIVRLWDVTTGRSKGLLRGHLAGVKPIVFSPDGRMLASVREGDRTVLVRDVITGRQIASLLLSSLKQYIYWADSIAISPDGDTLAAVGHDMQPTKYGDGTVELWSLRARRLLAVIRGAHSNDIRALAFSPNGKTLATGSWDQRVLLWDVTRLHGVIDGRPNRRQITPIELDDSAGPINALAFSPDGRTLAVGNEDRTIKLWNLDTREEVAVLAGHKDEINSVTFSSDGSLLISGSSDGTVHLWRAAPFTRTDDPQRVALGSNLLKR